MSFILSLFIISTKIIKKISKHEVQIIQNNQNHYSIYIYNIDSFLRTKKQSLKI